jgi:hypothetical protein
MNDFLKSLDAIYKNPNDPVQEEVKEEPKPKLNDSAEQAIKIAQMAEEIKAVQVKRELDTFKSVMAILDEDRKNSMQYQKDLHAMAEAIGKKNELTPEKTEEIYKYLMK